MKRIAYFGPAPTDEPSAVPGMARELLLALTDLGWEVDCYLSGTHVELPPTLRDIPALRVVGAGTRWRWGAWYSRQPLMAFVTGQAVRALGFLRLGRELERRHRNQPYESIYQFSQIEMFGLSSRLDRLPAVVVHPEVHLAGELRAFWGERRVARQNSTLPVFLGVLIMLVARAALQRGHLKRATRVICPSRAFARALLRDAPFLASRLTVVPNVIDTSFYTAATGEHGPNRARRVVFVGRISLRKGFPDIVRLAGDLPAGAILDIYGGHSLWSDYRPLLAALPACATYRGHVNAAQLRTELADADVLVQPSTYEPFGLTVAEAAACGVYVVAYDAVGAAEDLPDGAATRVPTGDYALLNAAVQKALAHPHDRAQVRAAAVELFGREAFRRNLARALDFP